MECKQKKRVLIIIANSLFWVVLAYVTGSVLVRNILSTYAAVDASFHLPIPQKFPKVDLHVFAVCLDL